MKYLTFSYDDGVRQDIRLTELFRTYGMKATFNLNSGRLGTTGHIRHYGFDVCYDTVRPDEVKQVYDGFEVACHGVLHHNFPTLDEAQLDEEILTDKRTLETLTGEPVVGAAYPCGVYDEHIADRLRKRGIFYCRTVNDSHGFDLPRDFNLWHPTAHDYDPAIFDLANAFLQADAEPTSVLYIWGHAFELDKTDTDRWSRFEKLLELLAGKKDIQYVCNRDIYRAFAK